MTLQSLQQSIKEERLKVLAKKLEEWGLRWNEEDELSFLSAAIEKVANEVFKEIVPKERTRKETIPAIANNPRFIEIVEQQNIGFNSAVKQYRENYEHFLNGGMNIDKDGKLDIWARMVMRVLEEFGWNVEEMATAIRELRDELEKKEKELQRAHDY